LLFFLGVLVPGGEKKKVWLQKAQNSNIKIMIIGSHI
jgi:hypothetical protein